MSEQRVIAYFGVVQVQRDGRGPLNLTLVGQPDDGSRETAYLAFAQANAVELPQSLQNPVVHRLNARTYRISASNHTWTFDAKHMHLHRDVSAEFYAAVPPRPAPLGKRIFWRLVLGLAATPIGRALLARRAR